MEAENAGCSADLPVEYSAESVVRDESIVDYSVEQIVE